MKQFRIETVVSCSYQEFRRIPLNADLLLRLSPPFPKVKIPRYDGFALGDEVHLEIQLGPIKMPWISVITHSHQDEQGLDFIDEGKTLPLGLSAWKHHHFFLKAGEHQLRIVDQVSYQAKNQILEMLLFPSLFGLLFYRKPFYHQIFKHETKLNT